MSFYTLLNPEYIAYHAFDINKRLNVFELRAIEIDAGPAFKDKASAKKAIGVVADLRDRPVRLSGTWGRDTVLDQNNEVSGITVHKIVKPSFAIFYPVEAYQILLDLRDDIFLMVHKGSSHKEIALEVNAMRIVKKKLRESDVKIYVERRLENRKRKRAGVLN